MLFNINRLPYTSETQIQTMEFLTEILLDIVNNNTPRALGFDFDDWFKVHGRGVRWIFCGQHKFLPLAIIAERYNRIIEFYSLDRCHLNSILDVVKKCKKAEDLRVFVRVTEQLKK